MTALLETEGLQKSFGAVIAAKDISVAARRGERLGLIGNNGAGRGSAAPSRSRSFSPA